MNSDEIMFQQYKLYTEQKEKFVDRSFQTNKFYLFLILTIVVVMYLTKDYSFVFGLTSTLVFSVAGLAICVLWWVNVDSYNFLIKVKLSKVIEEIEKKLPVQPYAQEFTAIKEFRKTKREFLFADMQKIFVTLVFLMFLVLFLNDLISALFS